MQYCKCLPGLELVNVPTKPGMVITKTCVPGSTAPIATIITAIVAGIFGLALLVSLVVVWVIKNRHTLGPPGLHCCYPLSSEQGKLPLWHHGSLPCLCTPSLHAVPDVAICRVQDTGCRHGLRPLAPADSRQRGEESLLTL